MTYVRKRGEGDCATAALASFLRQTYEDTYIEVVRIDPTWRGKHGLYNREVVDVAKRFRVTLRPTRRFDLSHDDGILRVKPNPGSPLHPWGHFVAVRDGRIRCAMVRRQLPWQEYLQRFGGRPSTLLKEIA